MTYSKHQRPRVELQCLPITPRYSPQPNHIMMLPLYKVTLEPWSIGLQYLGCHLTKTNVNMLTRKIVTVISSHKLDGSVISSSDHEKDLGVWASSNLKWKKWTSRQRKLTRFLDIIKGTLCSSEILQLDWLRRILAIQHRFGHYNQWNS